MVRARPLGSLGKLEEELLREKAAVLARIAGTLEELLTRLSVMRAGLGDLAGEERARQIGTYAALRAQSELYRWYLEVQREALGLRRHHVLDELDPIPEPIRA